MVTTRAASEQRAVLRNISWQTFETMLAEMGEDRASRITYDQGMLEIMTPLMPHEHWNCLLKMLIFVLGEELNLEIFPNHECPKFQYLYYEFLVLGHKS